MAALKSDPDRQKATKGADAHDLDRADSQADGSSLACAMREFEDLVLRFEARLLRSVDHDTGGRRDGDGGDEDHGEDDDDVRREACRLAVAELGARSTRLKIRRSLCAAEAQGRRVEQLLHAGAGLVGNDVDEDEDEDGDGDGDDLRSIHHGYFRLYSTELFDMLGQPVDLRLGTVRFHHCFADVSPHHGPVSLELALGSSFFVADALETLPFHTFKVPRTPSLQNRGILSRKPDDHGAFPAYDSWLLFTFLGNGCLKLEVPIEMCADVYGGPLRGRENEEVHFWGVFVDDDAP